MKKQKFIIYGNGSTKFISLENATDKLERSTINIAEWVGWLKDSSWHRKIFIFIPSDNKFEIGVQNATNEEMLYKSFDNIKDATDLYNKVFAGQY
jgi:hypothetical protein